ncbi:hypothetical protein CA13_65440 [Planctomycetes bacterium CA13]|uniref:DUF4303 domain-containing protein n=1 Tax=Novipirellula herctigrandis TaxID=2527986 RepID=A0A5C5ZCL6_9BACT|nr:hypothetical protein CA13_65440 [Planctomycetes bacterium CA13]
MNSDVDWALFYKFDGDRPSEFREVRRFGATVWQATGKPETWGEKTVKELESDEQTLAAFQHACVKCGDDGFILHQSGNCGRDGLDADHLTDVIYDGAKKAFDSVRRNHPRQAITRFGIYSDDSAMTIATAASTAVADTSPDDDSESLWNMSAWEFDEGSEYLDPAYRMILPPHRLIPCDEDTYDRSVIFAACANALARIRSEGFFGEPNDDLVVLFQVSDSGAGIGLNAKLNTATTFQRYSNWMG